MSTSTTKNQLLDLYNKKVSDIDQSAKNQKLSQASNHWRLMKYLPEQNAVNGITGGMSETAAIRANNAYAGRLRDIESNASAQKIAAEEQYNSELKNMYSENYNRAKSTIEGWNKSSVELDDYMKKLKDNGEVSDMDYQDLLNSYVTAKETVQEDERNQAEAAKITDISGKDYVPIGVNKNISRGDNFKVTVDGVPYKVQFGGYVDKGTDAYRAGLNVKGNLYLYDGELYYKDGENIHKVERRYLERENKSGANGYDMLIKALTATA